MLPDSATTWGQVPLHMFHMAHGGSSTPPYTMSASVHSPFTFALIDSTLSKKENFEGLRVSFGIDQENGKLGMEKKGIPQADSEKSIESSVSEMMASRMQLRT